MSKPVGDNRNTEHIRALLVFNPFAGENKSMRILPQVIKNMTDNGYACMTFTTTGVGAATDIVARYGEKCSMVVCSGGDGTANEIIRGLMTIEAEKRPVFGYIPSGSTNDFANALGIPKLVDQAVDNLVSGQIVPVDVGLFNDRYYAYVAAFGAFTDIAYTTSQDAKNIWGPLAYVVSGLGKLKDIRPVRARFTINGEEIVDDFIFCSISNSRIIGGVIRLKPAWVDLNDGKFEIILIKYPANAIETGKIVNAISSGEMRSCELIRMFSADEVRVEALGKDPISWSLDGESEKDVRVATIRNVKSGIRAIVPKAK